MTELEEQPLPPTVCPKCGAQATDDCIVKHRMSNLGYLHDDMEMECSVCGNRWTCGVPIGTGGFDDLKCTCQSNVENKAAWFREWLDWTQKSVNTEHFNSDQEAMLREMVDTFERMANLLLMHRVSLGELGSGKLIHHLKCPNCYGFTTVVRDIQPRPEGCKIIGQGISLVGYPEVTGSMEGADPYGWLKKEG